MSECGNEISDDSNPSSSNLCITHNSAFTEDTNGSTEDNTPKEKLHFLIEQRDKFLSELKTFVHAGHIKQEYHVYHHPPVYTCEEVTKLCPKIDESLKCGEFKNLFLKDKKRGTFYLISLLVDTDVQLRELAKLVGAKELRFANEEQLKENLNLLPGSVTPFGLINDTKGSVKYFLDKRANDTCGYFGFHPNSCISTVAIHKHDFVGIIQDVFPGKHVVNILGV